MPFLLQAALYPEITYPRYELTQNFSKCWISFGAFLGTNSQKAHYKKLFPNKGAFYFFCVKSSKATFKSGYLHSFLSLFPQIKHDNLHYQDNIQAHNNFW